MRTHRLTALFIGLSLVSTVAVGAEVQNTVFCDKGEQTWKALMMNIHGVPVAASLLQISKEAGGETVCHWYTARFERKEKETTIAFGPQGAYVIYRVVVQEHVDATSRDWVPDPTGTVKYAVLPDEEKSF